MANQALANFLHHYHGHTRGYVETDEEHSARIEAWEALPPFEQKLASLLYVIDDQVGGASPDAHVAFFAKQIQSWSRQLREALELQSSAPTPSVESSHSEL